MTTRVLLSTTSCQDIPGSHHELLESQGWEIARLRGPLNEEQMLKIAGELDGFLCVVAALVLGCMPTLRGRSAAGGLLFTEVEPDSFDDIAAECGQPYWDTGSLETYTV